MHSVSVPNRDNTREIERMMGQYGTRLLRLCTLRLGDAALAEDAVQETFVRAYRALDGFRGESSEATWLTSIAIRCCRDMQRGFWHRFVDQRVEIDNLPPSTAPVEAYDDSILREVMRLDPRQREAVLLVYYQDMKLADAALALGITLPALNARLHRAKKRLKGALERWLDA